MSARLIDGKAAAAEIRGRLRREVDALVAEGGTRPGLATVLVGDDPASAIYVGGKHRDCAEVGIESFDRRLPATATEDEVAGTLRELGEDPRVSGIILQLPLPAGLDQDRLIPLIPPAKDADGLTPASAGELAQGRPAMLPCTPAGVMELLAREGVELRGAEAVVLGRSILVGRPMAALLLGADATVTLCHSRTRDLAEVCRRADVLVAAVGVPRLVRGDWVKEGAVVIDVGMNRLEDGLAGDVDLEGAAARAAAITPVPGGVGPMTRAMLLVNTVAAARAAVAVPAA